MKRFVLDWLPLLAIALTFCASAWFAADAIIDLVAPDFTSINWVAH